MFGGIDSSKFTGDLTYVFVLLLPFNFVYAFLILNPLDLSPARNQLPRTLESTNR